MPDLDGMVNGSIQTSWYVNPDDSAGATFLLTATGLTTGQTAQTTFTDTAPAVKLGAFANISNLYTGGNLSSSQAAYSEGQSVAYRYAAANAEEGATITIDISYQF